MPNDRVPKIKKRVMKITYEQIIELDSPFLEQFFEEELDRLRETGSAKIANMEITEE